MTFVNTLRRYALIGLILTLIGCGTTQTKTQTQIAPQGLMSTLEYIPIAEKDKNGVPIPYETKTNPYANQKGRIKKEAILEFIKAKRLFTAKDFDSALIKFKNLSESYPKLSGSFVYLGEIADQQKDYLLSEKHYRSAIESNAENVNAYLRLALSQRKQGKFLEAQNSYAKLLSIWPDFPEAHLNIAILYDLYLNHPIRAQRHYEAFQFLTKGENEEVAKWLDDVKSRTGMPTELEYTQAFTGGN